MAKGALWSKVGRIGLAELNTFGASDAYKQLGAKHGPSAATARSAQEMIKALCDHVDQLEDKFERRGPAYKGVWKAGQTYPVGSFVTHGGSMWHADKATSFKPGEGGGWTLAVKRGGQA